ncbi:MAG TPA: Flp family type IVb pilin [Actinobacteria bacterium]|nr:hypothetical protein BMS3Bbin01_00063 [bacterium BMS3Bbin01]HDH27286.1 Flp family type IVb pilin [Actinomycetota bacterium]
MGWNPRDDTGAGLVEWGLLVILIAIVALIAVKYTGTQNLQMWSEIASSFP